MKEKRSVLGGEAICYFDYTLTPIESNGQVQSIIFVLEDVTEQVLNKKRIADQASLIQQQNELLEAVIENLNDVIIIYDGQGRVLLSNAEARRVYPHIHPDVQVNEVHTGYVCFDAENREIPWQSLPAFRVLKGERIKNMVMKVKRKDAVSIVEANAVPVYNEQNQMMAAIISHHDITQMKEFEEKLYQHKELLEILMKKNSNGFCSIFFPILSNSRGRRKRFTSIFTVRSSEKNAWSALRFRTKESESQKKNKAAFSNVLDR